MAVDAAVIAFQAKQRDAKAKVEEHAKVLSYHKPPTRLICRPWRTAGRSSEPRGSFFEPCELD
jgi:hypothetical protein